MVSEVVTPCPSRSIWLPGCQATDSPLISTKKQQQTGQAGVQLASMGHSWQSPPHWCGPETQQKKQKWGISEWTLQESSDSRID